MDRSSRGGRPPAGRRLLGRKKRFSPERRRTGLSATYARTDRARDNGAFFDDQATGEVFALLYGSGRALSAAEIMAGLDLPRGKRKSLAGLLDNLCRAQLLTCGDDGYYLAKTMVLVEGVVETHPQGYAFVRRAGRPAGKRAEDDVFIPARVLASAGHGDRVLVQIGAPRRRRPEGRIISVLARSAAKIVGIYMAGRSTGLVTPEDERFLFSIIIHREHSCGARNGDMVVAEITSRHKEQRNPTGRILTVLGDPDDLQVQADVTIVTRELPHVFDDEVLAQVTAMDQRVRLTADRVDLRDVPHVTIDGDDARDFDDAVSVARVARGFRLYVSIADVSHYVQPGSPVDREAYRRGTSVYFPNRVIPMLPERLSNELCSLVPDQDRYTFTAILDFDRSGKRVRKEFCRSVINSRRRLTYTAVSRIIVEQDPAVAAQYQDVRDMLMLMGELEGLLEKRRMTRGSIGFELPEARIVIDGEGKVVEIARRERNLAHKVIEEFMLAANEAVAETFAEQGLATLYRVHEVPDPVKVGEFVDFARTLGLRLPAQPGAPAWFGSVLKLVAGTPREYIVNNLLLRTMQQARYSPENAGHFGLAAAYYCHFTSPIRRYPDLVVHRVLAAFLRGDGGKRALALAGGGMDEAGDFLSKRERVAMEAEREMVERIAVRFMADRIGEIFAAVVSGITSFGLYVELLDVFVSGGVPIEEMRDDYYHFDERQHRLVGRQRKRIFQIGDLVRVRLKGVVKSRRHINFGLAD